MPVIDDFSEPGGDRYFLREDAFRFTLIREQPDGNVSDSQAWPVRILGRRLKHAIAEASEERARIRKELLEWLTIALAEAGEGARSMAGDFRVALDRICPEERAGEQSDGGRKEAASAGSAAGPPRLGRERNRP